MIRPDYRVSEAELVFKDGLHRQGVKLTPDLLKELKVADAYCSHHAFACNLDPDGLGVTVVFDPTALDSDHNSAYEHLSIRTNSINEPLHVIPISVVGRSSTSKLPAATGSEEVGR